MIDYRHPKRTSSTRIVKAGQTITLSRGESVSLAARPDGSRLVTR